MHPINGPEPQGLLWMIILTVAASMFGGLGAFVYGCLWLAGVM
jgi:hypothetical protein